MNTIIKILYQMKPSRQDIGKFKFDKSSGVRSSVHSSSPICKVPETYLKIQNYV